MTAGMLYFDAAGRLTSLAPGAHPAPSDSAALANVAASNADIARVACATLHYFYPSISCNGNAGGSTAARLAAVRAVPIGVRPTLVRAYPNPARETLTVEAPPAAGAVVELVEVSTGRRVRTQPLSAEGRATVDVRGLAPGVYRAQVQAKGGLVGSCKVVILP